MSARRDKLNIGDGEVFGEHVGPLPDGAETTKATLPKQFLSVWFRCCHMYGRMTRNAEQTQYVGRCPKCGSRVTARIGPGGTEQRMFEAK